MKLQGLGHVNSIKARDLQIGDILIWNYGHKAKVIGLRNVGKKSIAINEVYENGYTSERRRMLDSDVCIERLNN